MQHPYPAGQSKYAHLLLCIAGAFFLGILALYNGYPILSGDTTTYLDSGFHLTVPDERPIFYGLFLRFASLGASLWLAVFAQCLILSYLVITFIRGLAPRIGAMPLLGLLAIISLGTIAGWYAGQAMPDTFTPMVFLASANYLLFARSRKQAALLLGVCFLAIITHYAHCMISTLFALLIIGLSYFREQFRLLRRRSLVLLAVSAAAWLTIYTSNYIGGKGFTSSNASHVFLMGKLSESGVLKTYLDKACPTRGYKICPYKDSLPQVGWEFVWDQEHSPVFRTGGWMANKQEYNTIIGDIASRPKYWPFLAWKSLEATSRQIVVTNIDEGEERPWIRFERGHPLYECVAHWYPHEIPEFAGARQNMKTMNLSYYDDVYGWVLVLSSLICLFALRGSLLQEAKMIYLLVLVFLVLNAFVSATFANVATRLNSRAVWLLPMVNIVFIYRMGVIFFGRLRQRIG